MVHADDNYTETYRLYVTMDRVFWDTVTFDDDYPEIESGWVDLHWDSGREIYPSKNDVAPFAEITNWELLEDEMTLSEWVEEHTSGLRDNGDGTYYGEDEYVTNHSLKNGYVDTIAIHLYRNQTSGDVETLSAIPNWTR